MIHTFLHNFGLRICATRFYNFLFRNETSEATTPLSKLKLRGDAPQTPKSVRKRISKKIEQKLESSSSEDEESDEEEADSDEDIKPLEKQKPEPTRCVLTIFTLVVICS